MKKKMLQTLMLTSVLVMILAIGLILPAKVLLSPNLSSLGVQSLWAFIMARTVRMLSYLPLKR